MFGILRYLLAMLVIISHLWPQIALNLGGYAVFGFYILSGYLMTLVLNESYGFTIKGILKFFINRILRIYPSYLFILIISILTCFIIKPMPSQFAKIIIIPSSLQDWIKNITIFGLSRAKSIPMIVGVAWTLYIELVYYILMAVFFSKNKQITSIWFTVSLTITLFMVLKGYDHGARYYTIIAGSLPFSTGAMLYFYKNKFVFNPKYLLIVSTFLYIINLILSKKLGFKYFSYPGFYISYILTTLIIIGCINLTTINPSIKFKKIDKVLGNYSYPIYLCHWPIAIWVSVLIFSGNLQRNIYLFLLSIGFVHLFALLIIELIENKIEVYREKIKNKKNTFSVP